MKPNQKTLVVIALAVVLAGVGAFTILPSLNPAPAVAQATPKAKPDLAQTAPGKAPEAPGHPQTVDSAQKEVSVPEAAGPTVAATDPKDPTKPGEVSGAVQPTVGESSKLRDPFAKPSNVSGISSDLTAHAPASGTPKAPAPEAIASAAKPPKSGGSQPWLQPLSPSGGSLPAAGAGPLPMGGPVAAQEKATAVRLGPRYKLKGVMKGAVDLAVFEDADGNQRIVRVGEQCDAETKVTGISQGRVSIREKGKDKTLVIEEQTG